MREYVEAWMIIKLISKVIKDGMLMQHNWVTSTRVTSVQISIGGRVVSGLKVSTSSCTLAIENYHVLASVLKRTVYV